MSRIVHPPILGTLDLAWPDEAACRASAARLAARPGVREAVIELRGPLGAGKTTFVRHLLRALGVAGRVKSPTYAVMEPHDLPVPGGDGDAFDPAWHFDFYRFDDPQEWEDAGFRDVYAGRGLKLAEWPDRAAGLLPVPDLRIDIDFADGAGPDAQGSTREGPTAEGPGGAAAPGADAAGVAGNDEDDGEGGDDTSPAVAPRRARLTALTPRGLELLR